MARSRQARSRRRAISPRLAMRILRNSGMGRAFSQPKIFGNSRGREAIFARPTRPFHCPQKIPPQQKLSDGGGGGSAPVEPAELAGEAHDLLHLNVVPVAAVGAGAGFDLLLEIETGEIHRHAVAERV